MTMRDGVRDIARDTASRPGALVAGGAGFIGSHLCDRLLSDGYRVLCLDDLSTGRPANLAAARVDPAFAVARVDVCDAPTVRALAAGFGPLDLVFHLASPAAPRAYLERPLACLRAGSLGTDVLLGVAADAGARFVLASTSEVYGDPEEHPQREGYWGRVNPVGPRSVYDEAKRYAEALTTAVAGQTGVSTGIARIFNTYGRRMSDADGRAVPAFVGQALRGEPLTVAGSGAQTRSLCHVSDLVSGLVALAGSDRPGPVNLGRDEEITVLDLARRVVVLCASESTIRHTARPADDPARRRPDLSRARRELGWAPRVDLDTGLRDVIAEREAAFAAIDL